MAKQHRLVLGLLLCGVGLWAAPPQAAAQYGGQPSRNVFTAPQDATPKVAARPTTAAADAYDPNVWLAQRGGPSSRGALAARAARVNSSPRVASHAAAEVIPAPIAAGEVQYEMSSHMHPGISHEVGGCSSCGDGGCSADQCDSCGNHARCVPCGQTKLSHVELFAGPIGFKGPRDFGTNGNFGFHEGFNTSGPLGFFPCYDLGYQVGFQTTQSNLSGTADVSDSREQYFITAGFFSRKEVGLQWGAVWDWFRDDYQLGGVESDLETHQIRAQISLKNIRNHEFGFLAAVGTNDDIDPAGIIWEPTDQYALFYQFSFDNAATARIWGGLTSESDGLVGGDAIVPLSDSFSLGANWNYLIPNEGNNPVGQLNESWNIALNLTWHWRCSARSVRCSPYRPMFNVANNGYFMLQPGDAN